MKNQGNLSALRFPLVGFLVSVLATSMAAFQGQSPIDSREHLLICDPMLHALYAGIVPDPGWPLRQARTASGGLVPLVDSEQGGVSPDLDLEHLVQFLDRNGDGQIAGYEGAEAMLLLIELADSNSDSGVDYLELREFLEEEYEGERAERLQLFEELDVDCDGTLIQAEIPKELRGFLELSDTNGDGQVSQEEWFAAEDLGDPSLMFEQELLEFLGEVDQDGDGAFALTDLPERERAEFVGEFQGLDVDADGLVTKLELLALVEEELRGATFEVKGLTAHMSGVIGPSTPGRVLELILEHPEVETIVMLDVPGSMDDESNLRAARYVRKHGLATSIPAEGEIASGGTDFFLAGVTRLAEPGARFGVHSWSGFDEQGADVPRDDPEHGKYLEFYRDMDIPDEFYWYTPNAASADDIHWMTRDEIDRYGVLTSPMGAEDEPARSRVGASEETLDIDTADSPNGVVEIPEDVPPALRDTFTKYTRLVAPNGRPIHLFAQDGVSDEQLVRAREVMRFYLTDAPGTRFGTDKAVVANAMADNRAGLVYFNTERDAQRAFEDGVGELDLFLQDLYAEESVVEGSAEYMDNSVRDATLEEVFHLVQGAGIQPGLPEYHARIEESMRSAVENRRWFTNDEWEEEGSSSFEYIISVIDVYYGFWAHDPHGNGESFHGEYRYCTREAISESDKLGVEVLREFLPETFSFPVSVSAEFSGTFMLTNTPGFPFTLKSQYLVDVRLTGANNASLVGNAHDNVLAGNSGDDLLEGREGEDVAVFRGARKEYKIEIKDGVVHVIDGVPDRDGADKLREIEYLRFADETIECPR